MSSSPPSHSPLFTVPVRFVSRASALCLVVSLAVSFARAAGPVRDRHMEAELVSATAAMVPGQPLTLAVRLKHDPNWRSRWLNADHDCIETLISWTLPDGFIAGPTRQPLPEITQDAESRLIYDYSGEIFLLAEITPPASLDPGTKVELGAEVSWWGQDGGRGVANLVLDLPVAETASGETEWSAAIAKTQASLPTPLAELSAVAYREGSYQQGLVITLVIDATRDLNPEAGKFCFFDDLGTLEPGGQEIILRTRRQVRIKVNQGYLPENPASLSGWLRAAGGWFPGATEVHIGDFVVIDGPPPPQPSLEPLAFSAMRFIEASRPYRELRALYIQRRNQAGDEWVNSAYGRRLLATLKRLRAEAASAAVYDPEEPGGYRLAGYTHASGYISRFGSVSTSGFKKDQSRIDDAAWVISEFILERADGLLIPPLPPAAKAALDQGVKAAKAEDYLGAIKVFEAARRVDSARAPEIYFNLGLAESKLPGRELRAIAWFGAYLTADPYTPAPNEAAVLKQMNVLFEKNQANLARWLTSVQDAAETYAPHYRWSLLSQTVSLCADAGDIAGAKRAAGLIPRAESEYYSQHQILTAQLRVGQISEAQKTASIIQTQFELSTADSRYSGRKTELIFTLAQAQTEIAEARILAGDITGARTSLAAAQRSASLIGNSSYESDVQPSIAEAFIHAGDLDTARAVLVAARKAAEENLGTDARVRALVRIAQARLHAGDTADAREIFALAEGISGPANANDFAWRKAVAQALGGDVAGAQATVALLQDEPLLDRARTAITQAQIKRGEIEDARITAYTIVNEYEKSRALLAVMVAQGHGSTASDWLALLKDEDGSHPCPLNQAIFTDFASYLKSLGSGYLVSFETLRSISGREIEAKNTISQMMIPLTKK